MGFIDCDAHVLENEVTFSYLRPQDERFRPRIARELGSGPIPTDWWLIGDQRNLRHDGPSPFHPDADRQNFPPGTKDLSDLDARLRAMDDLGVDIQVLFPTIWLNVAVADSLAEAALKRSYNRWMADATSKSGGRLRWMVAVPTGDPSAAIEEVEFGAANGAVGLFFPGHIDGRHAAHESLFPIYRRAEELGLVVGFHTGAANTDTFHRFLGPHVGWRAFSLPTYAFYALITHRIPERFPGVKWGFFEAGSGWLPWIVQEFYRADGQLPFRGTGDWREHPDVLEEHNFYVACQIDDDIPYVAGRVGGTNLVCGSDWGHYDFGSDPAAHRLIAARPDVDEPLKRAITDDNARRLFGIDPSFRPADAAGVPARV